MVIYISAKSDEIVDLIEKLEDAVDPKKAWKEIRDKTDDLGKISEELEKKFEEAG
jgi:mannitol/fructose-specific phosphotransferase system IIA component